MTGAAWTRPSRRPCQHRRNCSDRGRHLIAGTEEEHDYDRLIGAKATPSSASRRHRYCRRGGNDRDRSRPGGYLG